MNEKSSKKSNLKVILAAICALILCVGVFAIVYINKGPKSKTEKGAKLITIQVVNKVGETSSYQIDTDAEYLKGAIEELASKNKKFTYSGTNSEYGLFIDTINGEKADYNVDQSFWAIYLGTEMTTYGVDSQPIKDGEVYKFVYEKSAY